MKNKHKQDFCRKIVIDEVTKRMQNFSSKVRLIRFLSRRRIRELELHF